MGRKFRYTDREVKEAILRAFTQQKTNKLGFRELYRELQKDPKVKIGGFTTLQRCLKRYVDDGFLKRDKKGGYALTEIGRLDHGKTIDHEMIASTKRMLQREIFPKTFSDRQSPEGIIPFTISIHLNPTVEKEIEWSQEFEDMSRSWKIPTAPPLSRLEAEQNYLDEMTRSVTKFYEEIFTKRIFTLNHHWAMYRLSRTKPSERRRFASAYLNIPYPTKTRKTGTKEDNDTKLNNFLKTFNEKLSEKKIPKKITPLRLDELLDFEGICIVRVASDQLKRSKDLIRARLVDWALSYPELVNVVKLENHPIMQTILTNEEYREYSKAITVKQREQYISELRKKYAKARTF